jgi:dimethylhistidine N-methyltransferase
MRFARTPALRSIPSNLSLLDLAPRASSLLAEVLSGLGERRKRLPPKLFYDARGAELFNRICGTQAYYPTRTERDILTRHAEDIARHLGAGGVVVEPGAGDMRKVRILLPALQPRAYVPIDISPDQLLEEAEILAREQRWLQVVAVSADFHARELNRMLALPPGRRVVFFPGSTIGNFEPGEALDFLRRARELAGEEGAALIGVDLHKPKPILDRAYNDPEGYTAQFNLNVLVRINREMGADFDLDAFAHRAFYNDAHGRIEMHLVCARRCTVSVAGQRVEFDAGETIHTENSYKYAPEMFARMARAAGFSTARRWSDAAGWFGVFLFT